MKRVAVLLPIVLALGAVTAASPTGAQEQHASIGMVKIKKCQTISNPGSYELANNIGGVPGDCLVITADFVSIDLAGFSISGGGGTAIITSPPSAQLLGIAVRNGVISGFPDGVVLGGNNAIVEGLRVLVVGASSTIGIAASGIVRNNTVSGSRFTGISGTGIISGNNVEARLFGIEVGQGSTVIDNRASGGFDGIIAACPSNITDNTFIGQLVLNGEGCNNTNNVVVGSPPS
jgi:hypothetical protein